MDIGVEFHGAVQPPTAMVLMKALEPYNPWFYEEVVQALNVDMMAELAKKTTSRWPPASASSPSGDSRKFSRSEPP